MSTLALDMQTLLTRSQAAYVAREEATDLCFRAINARDWEAAERYRNASVAEHENYLDRMVDAGRRLEQAENS